MESVEVHLFAAARAAAGTPTLRAAPGPLRAVLDELVREAPDLGPVLGRCSFLVDGVSVKSDNPDFPVLPGARLDVLPPFAGG